MSGSCAGQRNLEQTQSVKVPSVVSKFVSLPHRFVAHRGGMQEPGEGTPRDESSSAGGEYAPSLWNLLLRATRLKPYCRAQPVQPSTSSQLR